MNRRHETVLCMCLALASLGWPVATLAQDHTGQPILVLNSGGHTTAARQVLFSRDGHTLISVAYDKTIRFWDLTTGETLRVLRPSLAPGKPGELWAAALSPDGKLLAVGGIGLQENDHPVYLLDVPSGHIRWLLRGHTKMIKGLAFSPDGQRLASSSEDKTVLLWNMAKDAPEHRLTGHTGFVNLLVFSPDGRRLATSSCDFTGRIWSVATGQTEVVLKGHTNCVHAIAWSPDGRTLATAGTDESIRLWNPNGSNRGQFTNLGNHIQSLSFTPDSRHLLLTRGQRVQTGDNHQYACALLDVTTGQEKVRFDRHQAAVYDGQLSPDGTLAATSDAEGQIYVWRTATAAVVTRLAGKGKAVWSSAWSPDGQAVAWGNSRTTHVETNGMDPLQFSFRPADLEFGAAPDASFRRFQTARNGVTLVSTGRVSVGVNRGSQKIAELTYNANRAERVNCFTLLGTDRAVLGAGSGLYLFDLSTGKQVRKFQAHAGAILAVAPSPDGRYLLTACADQTLRIWNPDRDEPLLSLFVAGSDWIAWTPEGYYAASPGGENLMGWHINQRPNQLGTFYPAVQFRRTLYRPDVIKLLLRTGRVEAALVLADQSRTRPSAPTEVSKILPPLVVLTSPDRNSQNLTQSEVEVRATARSVSAHPVTALRLLVDGRPYQGQAALKKVAEPRLGEVQTSWKVQLTPGKHQLAVQAESAVSQAVSDAVFVVYREESRPDVELPSLYVLAVGISAYRGELKLNYAAKDAQAVARAFQDRSKPLFRKVETRLLVDQDATRAKVMQGLSWLRKEVTQRDVAVFYFAGHGQKDTDASFYLLPADVDAADLLSTGVAEGDLKRALAGMPGRVLALLDACHAGAVGGDKRRSSSSLTDDLVRDLVTDDYGVVVMASAMGREFSVESNEHRHGCFTLALVEGLSGKAANRDGVVYLHQLDGYVTERVKELTRGQQHPVTAKPTSIRSFPLSKP